MKSLFRERRCMGAVLAVTLLAGGGPLLARDGAELHVELPLLLTPTEDKSVTNVKSDAILSSREIQILRTATTEGDASFSGDRGTYSLKEGETLSGVVVLGEWQEDDVKPSWLFNMSDTDPDLAALLGKKSNEAETESEKKARDDRRKLRFEMLNRLSNSVRFKSFDVASYPDSAWFYCGKGRFENLDGDSNKSKVCLNDSDGDGAFDRVATVTFSGSANISIHSISVDEGATLAVPFKLTGPAPTKYKTVSTVWRHKGKYSFVTGFGAENLKRASSKKIADFQEYRKEFENGAAEQTVFGDTFKVELAEKKKRVNVVVTASSEAAVVVYPYELKFSESTE